MLMQAAWVARCRWVPVTTVALMAGSVALTGAVPATAAAFQTTVNCNTNPQALQPAIDGAATGAALRVTGPCIGPFTISRNLTLFGVGHAVLDGNQGGSTVTVTNNADVRLEGLTITNGHGANGGGLLNINSSTVTLKESAVTYNTADNTGGGIFNENGSSLTLDDSTVRYNNATSTGGIDNRGTARLKGSTVRNNTSATDSGGIYSGGSLTLDHSTVSYNTAGSPGGGGIFNDGTLTLDHATVNRNTAPFGGGIYNRNVANLIRSGVNDNTATGGPGSGGGIFNDGGTVSLNQSKVRSNTPDNCAPENTIGGCTG
ncbi:hypothetical protein [Streptomyces sp. NPDC097981]|uniref:hypothetical protein n=1 Tax=Streptomyces sp. NPDC097981 TaxID=3155428 RepID=UPI00331A4C31